MPTTTAKYGLRIPVGGDGANAPVMMSEFAADLEATMSAYASGTLASRPAAGKSGRLYRPTDGNLALDTGTSWLDIITSGYSGQLTLPGQGSGAGLVIGGDVNLYRQGANVLKTDDEFYSVGQIYANVGAATQVGLVSGNARPEVLFGPLGDTNLFRLEANHLQTDDALTVALGLTVGGGLVHKGNTVGFYGTAPIAKPNVTGARSEQVIGSDGFVHTVANDATLANLLAAFHSLGLITNSTTA